jgi:hypothetical protein
MKTNLKFKKSLGVLIILVGLVFIPLSFVGADSGTSLYLTPSSGSYNVGSLINVSLEINTGTETVNAVKASLSFNENLEVQSISKSGSILGLWMEEPSFDNSARTISFGGAGSGTTYTGPAGKLIMITFKVKNSGEGVINFTSSLVKYGGTTIEVKSASGGNYATNVPLPSSQPKTEEVQKSAEKLTPTKEVIAEEITTPEEPVVIAKEEVSQRSLLAALTVAWGGTSQLTLLIVISTLCLIALAFISLKEWKLFQRKKSDK